MRDHPSLRNRTDMAGDAVLREVTLALPMVPEIEIEASRTATAVAERRLVSVLFADLVGFTALSEHRDPEEVRDLLSRYFDRCRSLIERYGGTLEKFIGDAVVAAFGVPEAHEDDALRACRAALEMQARMVELNEGIEQRFGTRIAVTFFVGMCSIITPNGCGSSS